jgi:[ribosomal protein S5]-alanine N-acetyltransferase
MNINLGEWQIRPWRDGDIAALVNYANNENIWMSVRDIFPHPYTRKDALEWLEQAAKQPVTNFAIASLTEAIGGAGFTPQEDVYRKSAEIGYWVAEPFWGKGIATLAVNAIVQHAFANFDLVRLYATVFEPNRASARVLEKCGFQLEGRLRKSITKHGCTTDSFLYALVRDDLRSVC